MTKMMRLLPTRAAFKKNKRQGLTELHFAVVDVDADSNSLK